MRIKSLHLDGFKNLTDFDVELDGQSPISMVVGRNGAGKSNLLEALAIIFRDLDLSLNTGFSYRLSYEVRGELVSIDHAPSRKPRRIIRIDGVPASLQALLGGPGGARRLPDFVFGYYSGPTDRLKRHFERHQSAFNRALRNGEGVPMRRLFYAQPQHSQFVLLAFFLARDSQEVASFLRNYFRIESFDSALFVIGQPDWRAEGGDERFWNARGVVAELLSDLFDLSLGPMRLALPPNYQHGRRGKEALYLYLPSMAGLMDLAKSYDYSPQRLFSAFESILAADLLVDLRVRVHARGVDGSLTFRELSEGEQQLLMVLGLLRFTQENEALFLLDEPDTHLNPAWGLRYADMLLEHLGEGSASSQVIVASHDPLVVADMTASQIVLLERDDASGKVQASRPETDPRGMGVSALLTSDIYGLASELDPTTQEKLSRRRWLATASTLSAAERLELQKLSDELERLDFMLSDRDPVFSEFERAMRDLRSPALPLAKQPSVKRSERRLALERLRRILSRRDLGEGSDPSNPGRTDS